jgi:hypothetical protein
MNARAASGLARRIGAVIAAFTLATIVGCGGGEPETPACGSDFVGPIQAGGAAPGCEGEP